MHAYTSALFIAFFNMHAVFYATNNERIYNESYWYFFVWSVVFSSRFSPLTMKQKPLVLIFGVFFIFFIFYVLSFSGQNGSVKSMRWNASRLAINSNTQVNNLKAWIECTRLLSIRVTSQPSHTFHCILFTKEIQKCQQAYKVRSSIKNFVQRQFNFHINICCAIVSCRLGCHVRIKYFEFDSRTKIHTHTHNSQSVSTWSDGFLLEFWARTVRNFIYFSSSSAHFATFRIQTIIFFDCSEAHSRKCYIWFCIAHQHQPRKRLSEHPIHTPITFLSFMM